MSQNGPSPSIPKPSSERESLAAAWHAACASLDQPNGPSLREILGAYKMRGDGDREMLLAILGAKAAEDKRAAATVALHDTILQFHRLDPTLGAAGPRNYHPHYPHDGGNTQPMTVASNNSSNHDSNNSGTTIVPDSPSSSLPAIKVTNTNNHIHSPIPTPAPNPIAPLPHSPRKRPRTNPSPPPTLSLPSIHAPQSYPDHHPTHAHHHHPSSYPSSTTHHHPSSHSPPSHHSQPSSTSSPPGASFLTPPDHPMSHYYRSTMFQSSNNRFPPNVSVPVPPPLNTTSNSASSPSSSTSPSSYSRPHHAMSIGTLLTPTVSSPRAQDDYLLRHDDDHHGRPRTSSERSTSGDAIGS